MSIKNRKVNNHKVSPLKDKESTKRKLEKRENLSKDLLKNNPNERSTEQKDNVTNSKRTKFISLALVCLNIVIFIILFSILLLLLQFASTKIRLFFSEHVAVN